jgi:hypothetical protein
MLLNVGVRCDPWIFRTYPPNLSLFNQLNSVMSNDILF